MFLEMRKIVYFADHLPTIPIKFNEIRTALQKDMTRDHFEDWVSDELELWQHGYSPSHQKPSNKEEEHG
ncbi:hypothetical protein N7540_001658 [Penicillium herquei]|nr:hypothetical protein N7540_001658 [Penicillium herquei]